MANSNAEILEENDLLTRQLQSVLDENNLLMESLLKSELKCKAMKSKIENSSRENQKLNEKIRFLQVNVQMSTAIKSVKVKSHDEHSEDRY